MTDRGYLHRRSNNFGKVPYELMVDTSISAGAVRLYAYMHWRYGSDCDNHEGRASMGKALGVSERTITNYLAELEQADWIVIIPRTSKKGRTSNFYHVFEYREDCTQWRTAHKRPKPEREVSAHKGRKGVGGKPSHKNSDETNVNSSSPSYQGDDFRNSSSGTPMNSSSHDPDSFDLEIINETPNGVGSDEAEKPMTPYQQVRAEVITECRFAETSQSDDELYGRSGQITRFIMGKSVKVGKVTYQVAREQWVAKPGEFTTFAKWWRKKYRNADVPRNVAIIKERWEEWRLEVENKPPMQGVQITAAQLAEQALYGEAA